MKEIDPILTANEEFLAAHHQKESFFRHCRGEWNLDECETLSDLHAAILNDIFSLDG